MKLQNPEARPVKAFEASLKANAALLAKHGKAAVIAYQPLGKTKEKYVRFIELGSLDSKLGFTEYKERAFFFNIKHKDYNENISLLLKVLTTGEPYSNTYIGDFYALQIDADKNILEVK